MEQEMRFQVLSMAERAEVRREQQSRPRPSSPIEADIDLIAFRASERRAAQQRSQDHPATSLLLERAAGTAEMDAPGLRHGESFLPPLLVWQSEQQDRQHFAQISNEIASARSSCSEVDRVA